MAAGSLSFMLYLVFRVKVKVEMQLKAWMFTLLVKWRYASDRVWRQKCSQLIQTATAEGSVQPAVIDSGDEWQSFKNCINCEDFQTICPRRQMFSPLHTWPVRCEVGVTVSVRKSQKMLAFEEPPDVGGLFKQESSAVLSAVWNMH